VKISGSYTIDAPREVVWAALNDIEVLARIVPGCERLEQTGDNKFEGTVKIGIQSIRGTYSGRLRLEDIQPPYHYRMIASGRSANGVVDGAGTIDLVEQGGKTQLNYDGDAAIGGTLASVGQRLVEGAARQLINQSLKALVEQITLRTAPTPPPALVVPESAVAANGAALAPVPTVTPAAAPAGRVAQEVMQPAPPGGGAPFREQRIVIVPDHEQLKPEKVLTGVLQDFFQERPWLVWVAVAFVIGFLSGRLGRSR
jgi:hypothetical protein